MRYIKYYSFLKYVPYQRYENHSECGARHGETDGLSAFFVEERVQRDKGAGGGKAGAQACQGDKKQLRKISGYRLLLLSSRSQKLHGLFMIIARAYLLRYCRYK